MKYIPLIFSFILFFGCATKSSIQETSIESADKAYNQFDLKKSRAILNTLLESDSIISETKCKVLQKLAFQDWKYFKDYQLAKKRLMAADSIDVFKTETWNLTARIERESGNYQTSLSASEKARKNAKSDTEKMIAELEYAHTVYDLSINNLNNKIPLDTTLLDKTTDLLIEILASKMGSPKPSKFLLGISLLRNNGANVILSWKSYFHISDMRNTYPYLAGAAQELNEVCEKWDGAILPLEDQEKIILALSASRFYEFAGDYALCNSNEKNYGTAVTDMLTYAKYLKTIKSNTNEYYRLIAIGEENEREYKKWLDDTRKELWQNLSFSANKEYNEPDFLDATLRNFGARGFTGGTGNYQGYVLCLGHVVNQEKALVEQYGYAPEFTFTQIDMMASNGFSSWFWEDQAIGGWPTDNEIIRVREVYLNGPFEAWKTITDTIERQKTEVLIAEFLDQPKTDDLYTQTAGLERKLRFDALNELYNNLYSKGLRGNTLKLGFLSTYENYRIEASILGHEGRHSIEMKYKPEEFKNWANEEREFHAKLSQIIFATEPRLELAEMVNDISESGHGLANKKIVDIAMEWIKNNNDKIEGFSENKAVISQLYLLTNLQLKECYRAADPLFLAQQ